MDLSITVFENWVTFETEDSMVGGNFGSKCVITWEVDSGL